MLSVVRIQYLVLRKLRRVWLILAYDWPYPHEAGKELRLLDKKEMAFTSFPKASYKLLSV